MCRAAGWLLKDWWHREDPASPSCLGGCDMALTGGPHRPPLPGACAPALPLLGGHQLPAGPWVPRGVRVLMPFCIVDLLNSQSSPGNGEGFALKQESHCLHSTAYHLIRKICF